MKNAWKKVVINNEDYNYCHHFFCCFLFFLLTDRSSLPEMLRKKTFLNNIAKFKEKDLR